MLTVLSSYRYRGWCRGRRLLPLDRCRCCCCCGGLSEQSFDLIIRRHIQSRLAILVIDIQICTMLVKNGDHFEVSLLTGQVKRYPSLPLIFTSAPCSSRKLTTSRCSFSQAT
jgi:hypothetical protein